MKKRFIYGIAALLIVIAAQVGCQKAGNQPEPIPDISDFTVTGASGFAANTSATVNIYCSSIGSGTYTVHFDLAGANSLSSQSASLAISNDVGSFVTPTLANPGATYLTITSITNSNGGGITFQSGNTYTITDSTGQMMATIGASTSFWATDVLATITGTSLSIRGVMEEPSLSTMTIIVDSYTHQPGPIYFDTHIVPEIASIRYQAPGGGGFVSANGNLNIASVSPLIIGSFSFKGMDSTVVTSGTFTTLAPAY